MKVIVTVFDAEKWLLLIFSDNEAFHQLQSISTEPGTLKYYLDTCATNFYTSTGIVEHSVRMSDEEKEALAELEGRIERTAILKAADRESVLVRATGKLIVRGSIRENIYSAAATHRRQTLVVAVTYLDLIIEEFLRAIFVAEPKRMYEYLNQLAEQKGRVDLKEVLAAESKESLLQTLALRSAKVAAQGKFKATMRNIRQITGQGIHPTLVEKLDGLITRRNELVHETHDLEVDWREASDALSAVWDLARWLGAIAETAGVAAPAPEFGPDVWEDDAEQGAADGPSEP